MRVSVVRVFMISLALAPSPPFYTLRIVLVASIPFLREYLKERMEMKNRNIPLLSVMSSLPVVLSPIVLHLLTHSSQAGPMLHVGAVIHVVVRPCSNGGRC